MISNYRKVSDYNEIITDSTCLKNSVFILKLFLKNVYKCSLLFIETSQAQSMAAFSVTLNVVLLKLNSLATSWPHHALSLEVIMV